MNPLKLGMLYRCENCIYRAVLVMRDQSGEPKDYLLAELVPQAWSVKWYRVISMNNPLLERFFELQGEQFLCLYDVGTLVHHIKTKGNYIIRQTPQYNILEATREHAYGYSRESDQHLFELTPPQCLRFNRAQHVMEEPARFALIVKQLYSTRADQLIEDEAEKVIFAPPLPSPTPDQLSGDEAAVSD